MADEAKASDAAVEGLPEAGKEWTSSVALWIAGAFAAVGSALLAKVGFEDLGKGSAESTALACLALGGGVLGIVLVIGALAASRVPRRTPLGWLTSHRPFARSIRKSIEDKSDYLLSGRESIQALKTELDGLLDEQFAGTRATPHAELSTSKKRQLRDALSTKDLVVEFARDRRNQLAFRYWLCVALLGALLAGGGFAAFVGISQYGSQEQTREDAEKALAAGPLVPKTPSDVVVKVAPTVERDAAAQEALASRVGITCPLADGFDAVALEIGTPPSGNPATAVYHITSVRTEDCKVADMWVTPEELRPREVKTEEKKAGDDGASTPSSSPAPSTSP